MKKKLLNALRVRMGWQGYKVGIVTCPFDDQFHVAVVNRKGDLIDVYVPQDYADYDSIAKAIEASTGERVQIEPPQKTQEEIDETG